MEAVALDLSSTAVSHGPLPHLPPSTATEFTSSVFPSTSPPDDGLSSDDTGSTYAHDSSPPTPRDGECEEGIAAAHEICPLEPLSEERMQAFRQEYNRQVMLRFGDNSSSKCFTRNAANKVIKVMLGVEVDTKWVARSKERGLMLGNFSRPFPEEEAKQIPFTEACLWKQLIGDDGNPVLDSEGNTIVRKVALVEEFFDYINNLHFGEMKYVGEKSVFKRIREICSCLPRQAINIYKKLCPHCQRSSRAINSREKLAKRKMKENEESPFNGLSMVPMKRTYTSVGPDDNAKIPKIEKEEPVVLNPDRIKAAQIFIRHLVEHKLKYDKMFNDQPKDQIDLIIAAVGRQFPEVTPADVRGRIRSHLKSIRRAARKNGGCSERRRSLNSLCGTPAVAEIFEEALNSENQLRNGGEMTDCDAKDKVYQENNPGEQSPDLPTDLSVRKAPEDTHGILTSQENTTHADQARCIAAAMAVDAGEGQASQDSYVAVTQGYLNGSEYIRGEIYQIYLTSLLLPLLMNQLPTFNAEMTPHELMIRWLAQVHSGASAVLTAVERYEQLGSLFRDRQQH